MAQSGYNGDSPPGKKRGFRPEGAEVGHSCWGSDSIGNDAAQEVKQ
jgi:hypothetical protein